MQQAKDEATNEWRRVNSDEERIFFCRKKMRTRESHKNANLNLNLMRLRLEQKKSLNE